MSEPLQPINYMQQRDLTPSECWEFYQQKKTELEASVRECELEIKDLTIRAQKAEKERNEAREALEHIKRERQTFHEAWKKFCNPFLEAAQ